MRGEPFFVTKEWFPPHPLPRKSFWIFLDDSDQLECQWGIGIRIDNHGPGGSMPPAGCFSRVKNPLVFSLRMVPPHPPQESNSGFFWTILICLSASGAITDKDSHGPDGSMPPAGCFSRVKNPPGFFPENGSPRTPFQESRTGFFWTILISLSASDNLGTYGAYSAPPNQGHCPWTQ